MSGSVDHDVPIRVVEAVIGMGVEGDHGARPALHPGEPAPVSSLVVSHFSSVHAASSLFESMVAGMAYAHVPDANPIGLASA